MKTILIMLACIALLGMHEASAQNLKVEFTTENISGAKYSPKHVFAVWVKNQGGTFQNTLIVYAERRKSSLKNWMANTGGYRTDAISGATLNSHRSHSVTWNLKNFAGQPLPAGTYKLCMEIASRDGGGPYREIEFTIGGDDYMVQPASGSNFKNIKLTYDNGITSAPSETLGINDSYFSIFPNPSNGQYLKANIKLEQSSFVDIDIYNLSMQKIKSLQFKLSEGEHTVPMDSELSGLPVGAYYLFLRTNHYRAGQQIIITP